MDKSSGHKWTNPVDNFRYYRETERFACLNLQIILVLFVQRTSFPEV